MRKFCATDRDLSYYLWRMNKLWQAEIVKVLKEYNITHIQLEILGSIINLKDVDNIEDVTQIQISKFSGIDPMSTSTQLRILEKNGYITRAQSEIDTRSKTIELTEAASDLCFQIYQKIQILENELFAKKPDEKDGILKHVQRLFQSMMSFSNREGEINEIN